MNRHWRPFGQSGPVCLRSKSTSVFAALVSAATAVAASVIVCPSASLRAAPLLIVRNTASANPSATARSSEPLYFATAPYHLAASFGRPPTVSRAYSASSAAPPRMFCAASFFSRLAATPVAAAAAASDAPLSLRADARWRPSPLPLVLAEAGSVSCIGPKPPAALGAVIGSQRVSVCETASKTFSGTPNSTAASANALCSAPLCAVAGEIVVARRSSALSIDANSGRECVGRVMARLLLRGRDGTPGNKRAVTRRSPSYRVGTTAKYLSHVASVDCCDAKTSPRYVKKKIAHSLFGRAITPHVGRISPATTTAHVSDVTPGMATSRSMTPLTGTIAFRSTRRIPPKEGITRSAYA
jgi:hypothetical protein